MGPSLHGRRRGPESRQRRPCRPPRRDDLPSNTSSRPLSPADPRRVLLDRASTSRPGVFFVFWCTHTTLGPGQGGTGVRVESCKVLVCRLPLAHSAARDAPAEWAASRPVAACPRFLRGAATRCYQLLLLVLPGLLPPPLVRVPPRRAHTRPRQRPPPRRSGSSAAMDEYDELYVPPLGPCAPRVSMCC